MRGGSGLYQGRIIAVPSPYQGRTRAASCSDFVAKSEDALEEVRRWYGGGRELARGEWDIGEG